MFKNLLLLNILFISFFSKADNIDSLKNALKSEGDHRSVFTNLGLAYQKRMELDTAKIYFNSALSTFKEADTSKQHIVAISNLASVYANLRQFDTAQILFLDQLNLLKDKSDYNERVLCLTNLGRLYMLTGKSEQAQKSYSRAIDLMEYRKVENKTALALYNNLGTLYLQSDILPEAKKYFLEGLALAQESNDSSKQGDFNNNLALIHLNLNQLDSAIIYTTESIKFKTPKGGNNHIINSYLNLAYSYGLKNKQSMVEQSISKAESLINEQTSEILVKNFQRTLGNNLLLNKKYQEALVLLEKAQVPITDRDYFTHNNILVIGDLADAYKGLGDYKESLDYLERFNTIADSLRSKNLIDKLAEADKKYEASKKQIVIESQLKEKKSLQLQRFSLIAITVLLLGWGIFWLRNSKKIKRVNESLAQEIKERKYYQAIYYETAGRKLSVANSKGKREELDLGDVVFLQKELGSNTLNIHTNAKEKYSKTANISKVIDNELADSFFAQINKSTIVNLHSIESVDWDKNILLLNTKEFDVNAKKMIPTVIQLDIYQQGKIKEKLLVAYNNYTKNT